MATREYCSNLTQELSNWSDKLHHLSEKIDLIPSIDKYRLQPQIEELRIVMTELDDRLCDLMTHCETVETVEKKVHFPRQRFNKSKGIHFDYDFGG